jgi:hypothetical protein
VDDVPKVSFAHRGARVHSGLDEEGAPDGRLVSAGRVGIGIKQAELERLWRKLQPTTAAPQPLRLAAGFEPGALGTARAGRRSQIPDLDRRQPASPGDL